MKKAIFFLMTFVSLQGYASDFFDQNLRHLDFIHLDDRPSVNRHVSYPGIGEGGSRNPECLVLLTEQSSSWRLTPEKLMALAQELDVRNGPGPLFGRPEEGDELVPEIQTSRIVFQLTDLGKYITGIRVKSKNHHRLSDAIKAILGHNTGAVVLQLVRGCELDPRRG